MASPIYVIGKYRSGTKWLSNTIAGHPDVACIAHDDHFGILEVSDVFERLPKIFGDLSVAENFIGFIEYFASTDFFRLTGLDKQLFFNPRPKDYISFFKQMMDLYAENEGTQYWVQKADTFPVEQLMTQHLNAKFIMIIRDPKDNIRSAIALAMAESQRRNRRILNELFMYYLEKKRIVSYRGKPNVLVMSFEDMKGKKRETVERICEFIGIKFDEEMMTDRFKRNTSFGGAIQKGEVFSAIDEFLISVLIPILNILPRQFYELLYKIKTRFLGHSFLRPENRVLHSFKMRKIELGLD